MTQEIDYSIFHTLLDSPIAYHRCFVDISQSVTAAVMLSQAFYWSSPKRNKTENQWFYKSQTEWTEETGLSRAEQETARKKLRAIGVLEEKKQGIPCKLFFRINLRNLYNLLTEFHKQQSTYPANKYAGLSHTGEGDSSKQASDNLANNQYTENKTKTTAENTNTACAGDLYLQPLTNFSDSDLPANQVLIDCMVDQKENPIPPTPLSLVALENFATGAKAKKPSFEAKRAKYQPFLDVWVQDKVEDWVNHESLSKTAISKLETFTATHGDRAMEIFQKSLWYAQSDPFHKKVLKHWSLEQYLSNDKPYQNFEKYEQSPKKESAQGDVLMSDIDIKKAQIYAQLQQAMGVAS
jgi:hypothetical protein